MARLRYLHGQDRSLLDLPAQRMPQTSNSLYRLLPKWQQAVAVDEVGDA